MDNKREYQQEKQMKNFLTHVPNQGNESVALELGPYNFLAPTTLSQLQPELYNNTIEYYPTEGLFEFVLDGSPTTWVLGVRIAAKHDLFIIL
jgi:hypothetical protein